MSVKAAVIGLGVTLALTIAVLVGAGAGYLACRDRASVPAAVARGAAAFAATVTLACVITAALATL